jgi:hypothetical protein
MGIPPPPRLWGHAYCRWLCRGRRGRRVPLVRRLRMGSLLPGSCGAEPRGWLLVRHYRSLLTSPSLSPRAATSPRLILPTDRRESSTRSGGRGLLGCHCEASPTPLATALRTGASAQATVEQTIAADEEEQVSGSLSEPRDAALRRADDAVRGVQATSAACAARSTELRSTGRLHLSRARRFDELSLCDGTVRRAVSLLAIRGAPPASSHGPAYGLARVF